MISEDTYRIHRIIIYCFVLFLEVFGLFGNINLVVLTIRKKSLRTKYGCILGILATLHTLCLLYELVDMSFSVAASYYYYKIDRQTCFLVIFPYIFLYSMQTGTIWVLSVDLLITILYPIKSRNFHVPVYFVILFLLPVAYGAIFVGFGFMYLVEEALPMCNPPSALHPIVRSYWYYVMTAFSVLTVIFYVSAFALIYFKGRRENTDLRFIERKALNTLKYLILLFLMFRFITITITSIMIAIRIDQEVVEMVQNYNVLAVVVAYSQNAYICYYRSSEYRRLLSEQISKIHPKLGALLPKLSNESSSIVGQRWRNSTVSIGQTKKIKDNRH
ncbi:G-protein coupled receptors family 1 profile domain-containing protein [Caenorhabditis elegans]|uniref:G-protein coupled receptors family 1 profile domain-containing protein n=1 Tax=Caenorhabditis elegans TaxID=6239 RepID=Q18551_CAEEL|nr:G-protein coupled receptors family 1 profile domain-containing protein [Caenorhabditis elegans]CCD62220.1 G-protein coupled receptors family 1 profile domain-containing protein [Caenorhabditis elegans]|eukprot:NP_500835.2 Serpentine Receptor, class SX [Caenorhabditis elegans]